MNTNTSSEPMSEFQGAAQHFPTYQDDYVDRTREGSPSGEEELRFIRNFHDVFLSIGIALFGAGLAFVSSRMVLSLSGIDFDTNGVETEARQFLMMGGVVSLVNAGIMWGLAEVFARTRRLFLPAIVILLFFVGFVTAAILSFYGASFTELSGSFQETVDELQTLPLAITGSLAIATMAYYVRMKLPFAMGTGAMAMAGVVVSLFILLEPGVVLNNINSWVFGIGFALFLLGIYFDARDPERLTRLSDNGFWLHFFAAPLMFSSVVSAVGGAAGGERFVADDPLPAVAALIVVMVFALISLLINRRALLVSGLLTAAWAIGVLVANTGLDVGWTVGLSLLLLGAFMVLLGGGWKTVRRILVAGFPKTGWIARIVPPETVID